MLDAELKQDNIDTVILARNFHRRLQLTIVLGAEHTYYYVILTNYGGSAGSHSIKNTLSSYNGLRAGQG